MSNTPPDKYSSYEQRWNWLLDNLTDDISKRLYREAYRILQNTSDAEDAVQDGLYHAAINCWQLRDSSRFYAWMYTIIRREAYHKKRDTLRELVCCIRLHMNCAYAPSNPERLMLTAEERECLQRELAQLRSPEKEIVMLKSSTDKSLKEIAAELNLNYHTTRSKYTRALHYLEKKLLEGNHHEKN